MGRIRRVGLDTTVNYTLQATTAYDPSDPAATTLAWGDVAAQDQELTETEPEEEQEGALLTFTRFPDVFEGLHVKIHPTYADGNTPSLELWTHDSEEDVWIKRRAVVLSGLQGVESDAAKVFRFDLAIQRRNVDAVWITMNPGPTGTPVMRFLAIHLFGHCDAVIVTPGGCEDDPTVDCINPSACELNPFDPSCITPTVTCAQLGLEEDEDGNCIIPPSGGPSFPNDPTGGSNPVPPSSPPPFPTVDLCDPEAVNGFKGQLTEEQLAYFEGLLGDVEMPCLQPTPEGRTPQQQLPINKKPEGGPIVPAQPVEVYIDPRTLEPGPDPRAEGGDPEDSDSTLSFPFFFFYTSEDRDSFLTNLANESAEIQLQYALALAAGNVEIITAVTPGAHQGLGLTKIEFLMDSIPSGTLVGVRSLMQYSRRRTPWVGPGSEPLDYHQYLSTQNSFAAYVEGPVITEAGYKPNGWKELAAPLWLPAETQINGHKVYRKTGEDILTLEPAASTFVNENNLADAFGRINHLFDISDFAVFVSHIAIRQEGFVRAPQFCVRTIAGDSKPWFTQEFPYALYVHIELRPGFTPFSTTPGSITTVVTTVGSSVGAAAIAAETAAQTAASDPAAGEINDFFRTDCPFA